MADRSDGSKAERSMMNDKATRHNLFKWMVGFEESSLYEDYKEDLGFTADDWYEALSDAERKVNLHDELVRALRAIKHVIPLFKSIDFYANDSMSHAVGLVDAVLAKCEEERDEQSGSTPDC